MYSLVTILARTPQGKNYCAAEAEEEWLAQGHLMLEVRFKSQALWLSLGCCATPIIGHTDCIGPINPILAPNVSMALGQWADCPQLQPGSHSSGGWHGKRSICCCRPTCPPLCPFGLKWASWKKLPVMSSHHHHLLHCRAALCSRCYWLWAHLPVEVSRGVTGGVTGGPCENWCRIGHPNAKWEYAVSLQERREKTGSTLIMCSDFQPVHHGALQMVCRWSLGEG